MIVETSAWRIPLLSIARNAAIRNSAMHANIA